MQNSLELLKFSNADDAELAEIRIADCLSPGFFETEFTDSTSH